MTTTQSGVAVVGSANMDIVFTLDRAPAPGETLLADSAARYPGGKGLNQAVAAARSGAPTTFIGALGTDTNGDELARALSTDNIGTELVRRVEDDTGQAFIVVDATGENSIIVASGANHTVDSLTEPDRVAIGAAAVLLMQLELPIEVVVEAALTARAAGTVVLLNAAPAQRLPTRLVEALDYLIVNEYEACVIAGVDDLREASIALAAHVPRLIVTLGSAGSALYDAGVEGARVKAPAVTAVDTTGAGDTFCGVFAAGIADGRGFADAAEFATAAAALSVQSLGAVPSIPTRANIEATLR